MSGLGFDADQDRGVAALGVLHGGGVFEAVAGNDAVVVVRGRDQASAGYFVPGLMLCSGE